ncbi:cytochrome P450 [Flagelloscypha sp. PMI_526]|nr:cytochrome P450 [Flagelloscypha sp. PMI_526]
MAFNLTTLPILQDTAFSKTFQWSSLAALVLAAILARRFQTRNRLPPGPPSVPFFGSWFFTPNSSDQPWLKYQEWSRKYNSDVIYARVFGTDMLYLNSYEATVELLAKKGALYADRLFSTKGFRMGGSWHFGFMHYGDQWKNDRKIFTQEYNPSSSRQFRDITKKWVNTLLQNLLINPSNFMYQLQQYVPSFSAFKQILTIHLVSPAESRFIGAAQQAVDGLIHGTLFGSYLIDYLPILKYAPSWFSFVKQAKQWRVPIDIAGTQKPSLTSKLLEAHPEDEDSIRRVGAVTFAQGSAASVSALQTFILEMSRNPEIQKAAQEQLDSVLGGALPTIEDMPNLPIVSAIMKEVLRFGAVAPLAFPRRLTRDDEYKGYHLPKGSVVVPNSWAILHDEKAYPQPDTFDPRRFLTADSLQLRKDVRQPDAAFGYGYRVCPGRHFVTEELFLTMASILAVFDITGGPAHGAVAYGSGFLRYPDPFKCTIQPRSQASKDLIQSLSA